MGIVAIFVLSVAQVLFGCIIIRTLRRDRNESIVLAFKEGVGYGRTEVMQHHALLSLACTSFYAFLSYCVTGILHLVYGEPGFWYAGCSVGWWFGVWITWLVLYLRGRDLYQYIIYGPEGSFAERLCEIQR